MTGKGHERGVEQGEITLEGGFKCVYMLNCEINSTNGGTFSKSPIHI